MDKIEALLGKIENLPASPALLPRLAQALGDAKNTDVHEIVDIILFDAALTAKLLQIANSAYFSPPNPITTPGEAINQLGYDAVFLLTASLSGEKSIRVAPGTGLDAVLLWKHSVLTAFSAQHIVQARGHDGNLAFTAGLLHDLGKVVLATKFGKDYTSMFDPAKRGGVPLIEWETKQYGCHHAEIGAALMEKWKLPKSLVTAVKYHHDPAAAGEYAALAACIGLGDALSHTFEKSTFVLDLKDPQVQPALKIVNVTEDDLQKSWEEIRQKWEFVQALCNLRK